MGRVGPRVFHCKSGDLPLDTVYVGRPSRWGNPFKIGANGNRQQVIAKFRSSLSIEDRKKIRRELVGKNLSCWCSPLPCHADVLLEIANDEPGTEEKDDDDRL